MEMKQYLQSLLKEVELFYPWQKDGVDITITDHPYCTGSTTPTLHITSRAALNAFFRMKQAGLR